MRVLSDELLSPVFGLAMSDRNDHHARLTDFWLSNMLTTGRYKGNPVALHMIHAENLTGERFERWLQIWCDTSNEMLPARAALAVQAKAARIAESLQLAIQFRRPAAL